MIDIQTGQVFPLDEVPPQHIPGRKGPVSIATLMRWCHHGLHGIRLESLMCGGRRCVSAGALARFFESVTAAKEGQRGQSVVSNPRTARERKKAAIKASLELEQAGA